MRPLDARVGLLNKFNWFIGERRSFENTPERFGARGCRPVPQQDGVARAERARRRRLKNVAPVFAEHGSLRKATPCRRPLSHSNIVRQKAPSQEVTPVSQQIKNSSPKGGGIGSSGPGGRIRKTP